MPLAPAAKATIILAPIVLAAGVALYETHKEPIHAFVSDRIDDLRDIAEELGIRPSGQRRRRRHQAYGSTAAHDNDESATDETGLAALERYIRRRRSVDGWLRRRRSSVELGAREEESKAAVSGRDDESEGLRRRGGPAVGAAAGLGAGIAAEETLSVKQEDDEEEAEVPDPFADVSVKDEAEEARTPATLAAGVHTPTSEEDPLDFDMLDSQSEVTLGDFSSAGARTPTSEEGGFIDDGVSLASSSWSNVSSRVGDENEV